MILYIILGIIVVGVNTDDTCEVDEGNYYEDEMNRIRNELLQQVKNQEAKIRELHNELKRQDELMRKENKELREELATIHDTLFYDPEMDTYEFSTYGCNSENITLLCNNGGVINITHAYYGQYAYPNMDCPEPNFSEDCLELISENDPSQWMSLKLACDNESMCTFKNSGGQLYGCFEPPDANYMLIYYECIFDVPVAAISFTVYADQDKFYNPGDQIQFNGVISNIENHYDVTTNHFICPYDAPYTFSHSIMGASGTNDDIYANIIQETHSGTIYDDAENQYSKILGTVYASNKSQGSVTVVTECKMGERVWIEMATPGKVRGDGNLKLSTFSGFPLV